MHACVFKPSSQFPGNNCKWDDRATGFKVQSGHEALDSSFIVALSMKHFSKTVPGFVVGALDLDRILQDLLSQVPSPKPVQYQPLPRKGN